MSANFAVWEEGFRATSRRGSIARFPRLNSGQDQLEADQNDRPEH
jgi:hypothetical protein